MAKASFSKLQTLIGYLDRPTGFPVFNRIVNMAAIVYGICLIIMHSKGTTGIDNVFGDASLLNSGTSVGNVLVLDSNGRIPTAVAPTGLVSAGWTSTMVQPTRVSGDINAGGIRGLGMDTSASTATASMPRLLISKGDMSAAVPAVAGVPAPFTGTPSLTGLPSDVTVPRGGFVDIPFCCPAPPNAEVTVEEVNV